METTDKKDEGGFQLTIDFPGELQRLKSLADASGIKFEKIVVSTLLESATDFDKSLADLIECSSGNSILDAFLRDFLEKIRGKKK